MARPQIDILAQLMDRAFTGNEHALLDCWLSEVDPENWTGG